MKRKRNVIVKFLLSTFVFYKNGSNGYLNKKIMNAFFRKNIYSSSFLRVTKDWKMSQSGIL